MVISCFYPISSLNNEKHQGILIVKYRPPDKNMQSNSNLLSSMRGPRNFRQGGPGQTDKKKKL